MLGLFKKKDPICGMTKQEGSGLIEGGKWFCSAACLETYKRKKPAAARGCCAPRR